jgi:hypothetical protein
LKRGRAEPAAVGVCELEAHEASGQVEGLLGREAAWALQQFLEARDELARSMEVFCGEEFGVGHTAGAYRLDDGDAEELVVCGRDDEVGLLEQGGVGVAVGQVAEVEEFSRGAKGPLGGCEAARGGGEGLADDGDAKDDAVSLEDLAAKKIQTCYRWDGREQDVVISS